MLTNLNDKGHDGVKGSIIRAGRWSRYFGGKRDQYIAVEWHLLTGRFGASLGLADYDHAIQISLSLLLFSVYFTWENHRVENWLRAKTKRKDQKYGNGREIGFHWSEGRLFIKLWDDPMEWCKTDPWWWSFSVCPADLLLGKPAYSRRTLDTGKRSLTFPEKTYDVKIEITEDSWKRPRWPWPRKIVRTHSEVEGGIPIPGKGTTDYNCGPDAIYSLTSPGTTFDDALTGLFRSVTHAREHYPL